MKNIDFEKECNAIVEARNFSTTKLIGKILNKEGKELEKPLASISILAHILPELLTHGCVIRTTTNEIGEACNCKSTTVNNVLGFAGFKYERDRLTHKLGAESKGLFERYYQYEYSEDGSIKKTSSVFNIVATQKLYDLLSEELGLEIVVDEEELKKLHETSRAKAYTKSVKREKVIISFTKETTVFTNVEGTTANTTYSGIEEAIKQLQSLQEEQEEAVEELSFEDSNEEWLELEEDIEEVVTDELDDMTVSNNSKAIARTHTIKSFSNELEYDDNIEEYEFEEGFHAPEEKRIYVEGRGNVTMDEYKQIQEQRMQRTSSRSGSGLKGGGMARSALRYVKLDSTDFDVNDDEPSPLAGNIGIFGRRSAR